MATPAAAHRLYEDDFSRTRSRFRLMARWARYGFDWLEIGGPIVAFWLIASEGALCVEFTMTEKRDESDVLLSLSLNKVNRGGERLGLVVVMSHSDKTAGLLAGLF